MRHRNVIVLSIFVLLFIINAAASDFPLKVIPDPKPNLKEKNFIRLEKVGEIGDEVAKEEFLFSPFSATMDSQNNLFIYDRMQAKIFLFDPSFKFVRSFGSVGQGPGQFSGTGRGYSFTLEVGLDNRLYCHDFMARKLIVFDTKGKYIKDIRNPTPYGPTFLKPLADGNGDLILQEFRDDRVVIFNDKGESFFSIPHKEKKKENLFIDEKIYPGRYKGIPLKQGPFFYDGDELQMKLTSDSVLLLYFSRSATLYVVNLRDIKNAKKFRIWPEEAVKQMKAHVEKLKYGYSYLFWRIFLDRDQSDIFYLDFGVNKERARYCIYKMNLDGELLGVCYIPIEELSANTGFGLLLKQNNLFFFREDEKVTIYKEYKEVKK